MRISSASMIFFLALSFLAASGSRASLDDFKRGTERSGSRTGSGSGMGNEGGGCTPGSDSSECSCIAPMLKLLFGPWFYHNLSIIYFPYPYSHVTLFQKPDYSKDYENFIGYCDVEESSTGGLVYNQKRVSVWAEKVDGVLSRTVLERPELTDFKNYYLTFDLGAQDLGDEGRGYFGAIRGKFWKFIGPEIEVRHMDDGRDILNYYAVGINISIYQISGFMPDFYLQHISFRGLMHMSGWAYGLTVHSYPVKPLALFFRMGKQYFYTDSFKYKFVDLEGRAGFLINRYELFGGYRRIKTDFAALKGPLAGVKLHF